MQQSIIFTEAFNCGPILKVSLESFHKFHPNRKVWIFGTNADFEHLGELRNHPNNILYKFENDNPIVAKFKNGHEGTAEIFATMFASDAYIDAHIKEFVNCNVIHFDSDVIFKKESISLIENELNAGFDIVGSRRCYKNNPSGVPGLDNYPDTISTYFFGMNINKIPKFEHNDFAKMCQGAFHPLHYPVLDFFDPVVHAALHNGATILYLDSNLIGGQNEDGKKHNNFKSNLHLDCGSYLMHFGGVGSGYSFVNKHSNPQDAYANWAGIRYMLFAELFIPEHFIGFTKKTFIPTYDADGRWIDGNYDDKILNEIKEDLLRTELTKTSQPYIISLNEQ